MKIPLSLEESALVLRPVRGRGGFQSLLHRIQRTWNPEAGTVDVSRGDLERILRELGRGGPGGGFQRRLAALDPRRTMARSSLRVLRFEKRRTA